MKCVLNSEALRFEAPSVVVPVFAQDSSQRKRTNGTAMKARGKAQGMPISYQCFQAFIRHKLLARPKVTSIIIKLTSQGHFCASFKRSF